MSMWVELECRASGCFSNGRRMTAKDLQECNRRISAAEEILISNNVGLPVIHNAGQLNLF
jgi:hypothetical protein